MFGVTRGPFGLVAVGFDGTAGNEQGNAAVWYSQDGLTWSRVPHDEDVFGGSGVQRMLSVTAGGPGLVAVGFDQPDGPGSREAAVWTSPNGGQWTRVPHDEAIFGGAGAQLMMSVTSGDGGLVAVGSDGDVDYWSEGGGDAAVWTSQNGLTWRRITHDESVFGGDGPQRMNAVTSFGSGFVAVGSTAGVETMDAAVWTSPDGGTWNRVPHDPAVFSSTECISFCDGDRLFDAHEEMHGVTAGSQGLIAVGSGGAEQGHFTEAIWVSQDGVSWSKLLQNYDASLFNDYYTHMAGVVATGSGVVAVGRSAAGGESDYLFAGVWSGHVED
jgi:hypothetical protein